MAGIQILELRPVEAPIEDLSYDMTSSIQGGQDGESFRDRFLERWLVIQERFLDLTERWLDYFETDPVNL